MAKDDSFRTGMYGRTTSADESSRMMREAADRAAPGWQRIIGKLNEDPDRPRYGRDIADRFGQIPDVADMLPPEARAAFVFMREEAENRQSAYWALMETWNAAQIDLTKADIRYRSLTDPETHLNRTGIRPILIRQAGEDEAASVTDARVRLNNTKKKFDELTRRRDALGHESQIMRKLVTRAEEYLRGAFAGQTFEAFTGKLVKFASVEAARAEIDQIKAALDAAYVAPHPSSVVKAKIRHEIDSLANRGTPSLRAAVAHGESVHWKHAPANVKLTEDLATSRVAVTSPDALGLIAWAFRDKLISLLDAEIDAFADDKAALSDEQRDTMIAKLSADLLAAERAEVALVTSAGVDHRADVVDVRALLGIVGREGE